MIKSIFYSDSVESFSEYALNLEDRGIDYWVAKDIPELHSLIKQIDPEIIFIDYNMVDCKLFDVRKHVSEYRPNLIVLFFNNPNQDKKLQLIYWQDTVTQIYQHLYNMEIENFISDASGYVEPEYFGPQPTKLRGTIYDPNVNNKKIEKIELRKEDTKDLEEIEIKNNQNCTDMDIIQKLIKFRNKYKINFSEMMLLELLYKNQNRMVSVQEMLETIWPEEKERKINNIYSCIHNIRIFLDKTDKNAEIIRVKKGFYTLVSSKQNNDSILDA